jgi:rhomboid protease GluP
MTQPLDPEEKHKGDELQRVHRTCDPNIAVTWSLVLTAMEIPHQMIQENNDYTLNVPKEFSSRARLEIELYFEENENWPPKNTPIDETAPGLQPPTILLMGALALFYNVTGPWSAHSLWFLQGSGNSEAILNAGEWFRLVTALTLHADAVHLMGNIFLGGFLLHFLCRLQGNGLGLFAMLVSAVAGNWINVYLRGPGHYFVGFSTAVFATIGLLAMLNYHTRQKSAGLSLLMPFMGGAALLAMVGSSGERTDLGAHFFGLITGLALGRILALPTLLKIRSSLFLQTLLFLLSGFLLYISWQHALSKLH